MKLLALVFLGSGLGGCARYGIGLLVLRLGGASSLATFLVNVVGTFVAVAMATWLAKHASAATEQVRAFVSIGILGGFTTYSAFSVDVVLAASARSWMSAAVILAGTVLGCLASGALAFVISR